MNLLSAHVNGRIGTNTPVQIVFRIFSRKGDPRGAHLLRNFQQATQSPEAYKKKFNPEIIIRGNSLDDAVVEGVEEDWEQAIKRYNRRWNKIKSVFPKEVRRFDEERVCLHDADVVSMGRQGDKFVMVMHKEPPSQEMVVLLFTLDGEPKIESTLQLPGRNHASYGHWM